MRSRNSTDILEEQSRRESLTINSDSQSVAIIGVAILDSYSRRCQLICHTTKHSSMPSLQWSKQRSQTGIGQLLAGTQLCAPIAQGRLAVRHHPEGGTPVLREGTNLTAIHPPGACPVTCRVVLVYCLRHRHRTAAKTETQASRYFVPMQVSLPQRAPLTLVGRLSVTSQQLPRKAAGD